MKNRILVFCILLLAFALEGCFVPKVAPKDIQEQRCELKTKKLTLDVDFNGDDLENVGKATFEIMSRCDRAECALAPVIVPVAIAAVPVASIIVSGSIVIVGNTVHWLEQQGRCDESVTRRSANFLIDSTRDIGGVVVTSGEEVTQWFKKTLKFDSTEPEKAQEEAPKSEP